MADLFQHGLLGGVWLDVLPVRAKAISELDVPHPLPVVALVAQGVARSLTKVYRNLAQSAPAGAQLADGCNLRLARRGRALFQRNRPLRELAQRMHTLALLGGVRISACPLVLSGGTRHRRAPSTS